MNKNSYEQKLTCKNTTETKFVVIFIKLYKNMPSDHKTISLIEKILKILLPLGVSAGLVVWLLHKVNLHQVLEIVHHGVDYRFLFIMMIVIVLSHVFRGIRWGIQLRAAGIERLPVMTECVSIFGAYALNLVFTYLGEAWRCVYISKLTNAKLSTVVGTDIGDRGSDAVMIGLISAVAFFAARPAIDSFLDKYEIGKEITHFCTDGTMWLWVLGVLLVLSGLCYALRNTAYIKGLIASASRIWQGFVVLFRLKSWPMYIVLTFAIWACYFLETYLCFWAFPFTRELIHGSGMAYGLIPGLVVFVFGSFSIAIPSNGGLGPWNIAVAFALSLYGISEVDGAAYSLVCWSFTSLTLVLLGIFSALYIMVRKHKRNISREEK